MLPDLPGSEDRQRQNYVEQHCEGKAADTAQTVIFRLNLKWQLNNALALAGIDFQNVGYGLRSHARHLSHALYRHHLALLQKSLENVRGCFNMGQVAFLPTWIE